MDEVQYGDFSEGDVYDCGEYTVTEAEILAFARQWDPQPFHTDPDVGKNSPFGELVASGWHTVAICTRLVITELYGNRGSRGAPGAEAIRWENPVRPGDTLSARSEVLSRRPLESRPHLGLVKIRMSMTNQRGESVLSMIIPVFFSRHDES